LRALLAPLRAYVAEDGRGLLGSLALHGLFALLVLYLIVETRNATQPKPSRLVPVDVVRLGSETTSPPAPVRSTVAQRRPSPPHEASNPRPHEGTAPAKTRPVPIDDLDMKLRGLARLKQPETKLPAIENSTGASDVDSASDAEPGDNAAYALKDFVRAQVLRRWSLNLERLGKRNFDIALHVVMTRDGRITEAEIVDKKRYTDDAVFHQIALSAKNAAILASPISLPPGEYEPVMRMTLALNTRDALQ
jgi:hypothetical protein